MRPVTRRERRAERQRRNTVAREVSLAAGLERQVSNRDGADKATDYEAHLAGWLGPLDYRVSGESGALTVHTHSMSWHRAKSPNITIPLSGQGWDRSGPVRVVGSTKLTLPIRTSTPSEVSG